MERCKFVVGRRTCLLARLLSCFLPASYSLLLSLSLTHSPTPACRLSPVYNLHPLHLDLLLPSWFPISLPPPSLAATNHQPTNHPTTTTTSSPPRSSSLPQSQHTHTHNSPHTTHNTQHNTHNTHSLTLTIDLLAMVPRPSPSPEPAETFPLSIGDSLIDVPRLWTGLWQLSSPAWGTAPASRIRKEMLKHVSKGFTAFGTRRFVTPFFFPISSSRYPFLLTPRTSRTSRTRTVARAPTLPPPSSSSSPSTPPFY